MTSVMYSRSLSLGSSGEVGRPVAELGVIHPFEAKEEEMERNRTKSLE